MYVCMRDDGDCSAAFFHSTHYQRELFSINFPLKLYLDLCLVLDCCEVDDVAAREDIL